jgi:cyclophilin family peptidyl-prolyl cis-trans isomerase
MANRGKNTNGMQFFIMDGQAPYLDGGYTIFGKCGPDDVITKLAGVEVQGDRSVKPTKINKVIIKRKPKKADKADAKAAGSAAPHADAPAAGVAPGVPSPPPAH